MKSLFCLATTFVSAASVKDYGVTLPSLNGDLPEITEFYRWDMSNRVKHSAMLRAKARASSYHSMRTPANCTFPLEVVILQDATNSFSDNIQEMKNKQLAEMVSGLSKSHPGSKFAVVAFQDKPILPYGNRDDACEIVTADFTTEFEPIYDIYSKLVTYGGADAPENQFGALIAALDTQKLSWSPINSEYARLVVVVTDSGPHHAADGILPATGVPLAPFPGTFSDAQSEQLCLKTAYPSEQQVYDRVVAKQTYVASLIYDSDWANGWPATSWKSFNRFLAQPDAFVQKDAEDSSMFWEALSAIITQLENIECLPDSTPAPVTTAGPTQTTSTPSVMPTGECQPTVIVDGECVPSKENCYCQPDVLIKLAYKPEKLDLVADDKVVAKW